ncbi:WXG100 family type VII secretion target [Nocardioides gilvus]|uniref:WXG100 family type VII secretion target n=1 Tax=Nocardioides gilvus TaxID=1735589 RepID=UPI000D74C99E|nr:WXG100 family type VII secretion target [Nocardioides gilvus]
MTDHNAARGLSAATGVLDQAATTVEEARVDVTRLSAELGAQIQGLGGRWSGEGARAFTQLHVAWQDKQRRIVAALDDFAASLTHTERDNRSTDLSRSDSAIALAHRLG